LESTRGAFTPWLALCGALTLAACGAGGPVDDADTGGGAPLEVTVRSDRASYEAGARPTLTLTLRNRGDEAVTLHFTSSQRYDFRVEDASGRVVWTWSAARSFMQVLGSATLEAGDEVSWTERTESALAPGEYTAVGMVTDREGPLVARAAFTVR
jgi:hypothetical protein